MKRHTCHPAGYDDPGPARRIGQQDAPGADGGDTAMTSESGPLYWVGGAQVTCPHCSTPLVRGELCEPPDLDTTVLVVVRCPACPFVMVGADPDLGTVEWERGEPALFAADFRPDERVSLVVPRPE